MKKGLGRGLDALISSKPIISAENKKGIVDLDINKIDPNKEQPRKYFDEDSLIELSESIKKYGVVQPIIVNDLENGFFTIVAGERRYRACRIANIQKIPAVIKNYTDEEILEIALIENIQREDLNLIEEANCYFRLHTDFFFTYEDIAKKVCKSKTTIYNTVNLLKLSLEVQQLVINNKLQYSFAKLLSKIEDHKLQLVFAMKVIEENLSLKQLEQLFNKEIKNSEVIAENKNTHVQEIYTNIENDLKNIFGTKVNLKTSKNKDKGKIEIEWKSNDDLERLLLLLKNIQ